MRGSQDQKRAFLKGYLDSDGSFSRDSLEYVTKSPDLGRTVCELMDSMGILYRIRDKVIRTGPYKGNVYKRIQVRSESLPSFCGGPYWSRKVRSIEEYVAKSNTLNNTDYVSLTESWVREYLGRLEEESRGTSRRDGLCLRSLYNTICKGRRRFTKTLLRKVGPLPHYLEVLMAYSPIEIIGIREGVEDVYDVSVPGTEEYMAQGSKPQYPSQPYAQQKLSCKRTQKPATS